MKYKLIIYYYFSFIYNLQLHQDIYMNKLHTIISSPYQNRPHLKNIQKVKRSHTLELNSHQQYPIKFRNLNNYTQIMKKKSYQMPLYQNSIKLFPELKHEIFYKSKQNKIKRQSEKKIIDRRKLTRIKQKILTDTTQIIEKKKKLIKFNKLNKKEIQVNQELQQSINNYYEYTLKYSFRTQPGINIKNQVKINQDNLILSPSLNNQTYKHFFAVCDGHGSEGHLVSNFIKRTFINQLKEFRIKTKEFQLNYDNIIKNYFMKVEHMLQKSDIQINNSGSTCVSIWIFNSKIYCANLGDSRAIIAQQIIPRFIISKQQPINLKIIQLSRDHKLQCQDQAKRVISSGGLIEKINGKGPLRIWAKGENSPGLSMSRSFGDKVASSIGTIHIPEISVYEMNKLERIMVIASDGLWQFLSNQQVIQIIKPYYSKKDLDGACLTLLNMAKLKWKKYSRVIDDISFMIFFFYLE